MSRVVFDQQPNLSRVNRSRADVLCCVGLARPLKGAALAASTQLWLQSLGFKAAQIASLTQVPIPLESQAAFTALFDDGSSGQGFGTDYAAAAIRSFFAQGGKKCYLVCADVPVAPTDSAATRQQKLAGLIGSAAAAYAADGPAGWLGVGMLEALEEVSLLIVPDLPALCASQPVGATGRTPVVPLAPQEFTECAPGPVGVAQQRTFAAAAPRLSSEDLSRAGGWAQQVATIIGYLASGPQRNQPNLREIQLISAFPLLQDLSVAAAAENPDSDEIAQDMHALIDLYLPEAPAGPNASLPTLSTAFLQLAFPWLKTSGSGLLLEQLEPPEGALAGLIARNALSRGTFTCAAQLAPAEIYDLYPALPAHETRSATKPLVWWPQESPTAKPLVERLSLFGWSATGLSLLSDVTTYAGESYRQAALNRLVCVICRGARVMGESAVFESNGPALWSRIERRLQNLLTRLYALNALDGATAQDAFSVRCDAGTMTQNDIDSGRLIAQVTFNAAGLIETLHVQLAVEPGGASAQEIAAGLAAAAGNLGNAGAALTAGMS